MLFELRGIKLGKNSDRLRTGHLLPLSHMGTRSSDSREVTKEEWPTAQGRTQRSSACPQGCLCFPSLLAFCVMGSPPKSPGVPDPLDRRFSVSVPEWKPSSAPSKGTPPMGKTGGVRWQTSEAGMRRGGGPALPQLIRKGTLFSRGN